MIECCYNEEENKFYECETISPDKQQCVVCGRKYPIYSGED